MSGYTPPAGAGTAYNLLFCALGSLRLAQDAMWELSEHAEKHMASAVDELQRAIHERRSELAAHRKEQT